MRFAYPRFAWLAALIAVALAASRDSRAIRCRRSSPMRPPFSKVPKFAFGAIVLPKILTLWLRRNRRR